MNTENILSRAVSSFQILHFVKILIYNKYHIDKVLLILHRSWHNILLYCSIHYFFTNFAKFYITSEILAKIFTSFKL